MNLLNVTLIADETERLQRVSSELYLETGLKFIKDFLASATTNRDVCCLKKQSASAGRIMRMYFNASIVDC